jgi:hypothetical integral membrane protein (TIGR02206 family)
MDSFFSLDCPNGPFILFSSPHIAALAAIFLLNILVCLFRNRLKDDKMRGAFRLCLASLLIIQEISFHIWNIATGQWSINNTLPLQLCSISTILSAILLISRSYSIYEIVYFWGIGGALQAIITPEIGIYTYPHFRFFQFFICHGSIIMACLFMTFVEGYRPKLKSVFKAFTVLNLYAGIVAVFNCITNSNYLFICGKPEVSSIMNFLGPWPWYILSLDALALFIFILLYLPFHLKRLMSKKISTTLPNNRSMNF